MIRLAVLLACYNRKEMTINCIRKLLVQSKETDMHVEIFVCDDNSSDGTAQAIRELFPEIHLYVSEGSLYWCKSMHRVMQWAFEKHFDLYLMVNDDVDFFPTMYSVMLNSYMLANEECGIVGSTKSKEGVITYGGRCGEFDLTFVMPQKKLEKCGVANWNCFMLSNTVIEKVGLIDSKYEHGFGDFDYSMQMQKKGIPIYVATDYVGLCERNSKAGTYEDDTISRWIRLKKLFGKKGKPIYSTFYYYKKNFGRAYYLIVIKRYIEIIGKILIGKS